MYIGIRSTFVRSTNSRYMSTLTENILNVTLLEPRQKHPVIFARFDELGAGQSLTIHNDHDPRPLYYQLLGERGNTFSWQYLEQGPEWWKVTITKRAETASGTTLGDIVAKDLRKAEVFKKHGIDFCCGGKKTVAEACAEKGLDAGMLEQELQAATKLPEARPVNYTDWPLDFLADYIVLTHHNYVNRTLPELRTYAEKVLAAHGDRHPELLRINQLVQESCNEMAAHMIKEERILFPYIKQLAAGKVAMGSVQQPIRMMEMEHEIVGSNLAEISNLSGNFTPPSDACGSYSLFYRLLAEFEADLHLHVHLENNILFPKALILEKTMVA